MFAVPPGQHILITKDETIALIPSGLAAVPEGQVQVLREVFGGGGHDVVFADMAVLAATRPGSSRLSAGFMGQHPGQRVRCVDEPAWPGRSVEEAREIARHEALVNRVFAGMAAAIVCPYDSRPLPLRCSMGLGVRARICWLRAGGSRTVPAVARVSRRRATPRCSRRRQPRRRMSAIRACAGCGNG